MASLMTAPMVIIEVFLMRSMYQKKKWNITIIIVSILVLVCSFAFIKEQAAIDDEQFIMSMIPHHSSAILMCEQASIEDPELKQLCEDIILNQQEEIEQMKEILSRMKEDK